MIEYRYTLTTSQRELYDAALTIINIVSKEKENGRRDSRKEKAFDEIVRRLGDCDHGCGGSGDIRGRA